MKCLMPKKTNHRMIKLKIIFLPFLIVLISVVVTLTTLRWVLDIKLGIITVNKFTLDFHVPVIFTVISVLVFMRKRLRILDFKDCYLSGMYMIFFMVLAILFPACFSQKIVSSAPYDLIEFNKVDSIGSVDKQKFFRFNQYIVEPEKAVFGIDYRKSGKRNENLNMYLLIAVPFQSKVNAWYGISYYKRINNHLDNKEKKAELDIFIQETEKKYSKHDFYNKTYFELLPASDELDRLKSIINQANPDREGLPVYILRPYENEFNDKDSGTIKDLFWSTLMSILIIYLLLIKPKVSCQYLSKRRS